VGRLQNLLQVEKYPPPIPLSRQAVFLDLIFQTNWIFIAKMTTPNEFTQCLNLARALDLITSSRTIGGVLYVYNAAGHAKRWDSFIAEYPLERLQAMVTRQRRSPEFKST
jgi:hypothetical protein